jgi:carboxypeptidase Q
MRVHRTGWPVFAILAVCLLAPSPGQAQSKRGPSTPEERQRFLAVAHRLEETPLDPALRSEKQWALLWLLEVPDFTVNVCTAPLGDFMKKKYKYSGEVVIQLTFSGGAFLIEHPDQAKDTGAQYVAGVEGALKAYQSILRAKPDAKSKELDDLIEKQSRGVLAGYVRDAAGQGCKSKTSNGL